MSNQFATADHGFLDALHTTSQQVQALETRYSKLSKELQEQLAKMARELETLKHERDGLQEQVQQLRQELDASHSAVPAKRVFDPEEARKACEDMDRISEENRRRFGVQDIGVQIIREMRDVR